jgi:single-strand DNA-binding protein
MRDINRVEITGHLTRDSEHKVTNGGADLLSFGMAVNDSVRNQATGEWDERANFIDVVFFGKASEWMQGELVKGRFVMVDGKLRYSSWERDGQRASKIEVVADNIRFDGRRTESKRVQQSPTRQAAAPQEHASGFGSTYDPSIPF